MLFFSGIENVPAFLLDKNCTQLKNFSQAGFSIEQIRASFSADIQLVFILTSKWVLCTPFAGWNHPFELLDKFFYLFPSQMGKRRKIVKKVKIHTKMGLLEFKSVNVYFYFHTFFFVTIKFFLKAEEDDFSQQMVCKPPIHRSKYTTSMHKMHSFVWSCPDNYF